MSSEYDVRKLDNALRIIGQNETLRTSFVAECKAVEKLLAYPGGSVRDDITGSIVDALHGDVGILRKRLSSGILFDFYYRSKIARDFVMSDPEVPDHVWEPQTTKLLLHLSTRAKDVIVGGAYFGDHVVLIAKQLLNTDGTCHAFEPNVEQARMLIHNIEINDLHNVKVSQMALWDQDAGRVRLVGEDAFASPEAVIEGSEFALEGNETCGTITIDTYLKEQNIKQVDLIMLDIEGGEYKALQGASGQLCLSREDAPSIVFEIHRNYVDWSSGLEETEIVKYLSSFGYQVFAVRDFHSNYDMGDRPIEIIAPKDTYLEGPPHGFNVVAVKDISILQGKHFRMCRGVSPKLLFHKDPSLHHPMDGL